MAIFRSSACLISLAVAALVTLSTSFTLLASTVDAATSHMSHHEKLHQSSDSVRVRKEWRVLSDDTRHRVAAAFWEIKTLSQAKGRAKYGANFYNYDDMLMGHACSLFDPRCDQVCCVPGWLWCVHCARTLARNFDPRLPMQVPI